MTAPDDPRAARLAPAMLPNTEAARSAANFIRESSMRKRHTEAVSDCEHCNGVFLADWALNVLKDTAALSGSSAAPQTNTDPEQTLAAHLFQELKPDCCCGVCEVLREYFEETFAATAPQRPTP